MDPRIQMKSLVFFLIFLMSYIIIQVNGEEPPPFVHFNEQMQKLQKFKSSLIRRELASSPTTTPSPPPKYFSPAPSPEAVSVQPGGRARVFQVTSYGADPSGQLDSTGAIIKAIAAAFASGSKDLLLMKGIKNLGGALINLEGGIYKISQPLQLPAAGVGNLVISGGTLLASDDFPTDGYLIDLSSSTSSSYNYEYITLKDLMLDCNFRGGGISVINSLRTSIDNCYITHFTTNGILVQRGHETYIRNSFLGQHITAGADSGERNFSGTGINLMGNDNAVTDVVIFSAAIGIMVSGQGNTFSGVHCYNKATGIGGTGIYLKLPNLTQTRIINCYLDYNGIIAEDPVQLTITNSFFLGDGYVILRSIKGVAKGVNIVDNMFSGTNKGIDIVQLDQSNGPFKDIEQVLVDRNNVKGMNLRATIARQSIKGNGTSWNVDFSPILLFPDLINHVQYSFTVNDNSFPNYALRNVSKNQVMIESDVAVDARVFVLVNQGLTS